jgi:predicted nucleic acid-binding protein
VSTRVYLDANVFIYAYETVGARSDHAWWLLDAIEDGELWGVTSELTVAELLVGPMQIGDDELVRRYQSIIAAGEGIEIPVVNRDILIEAAILRSTVRSLKLPDAIHVATARTAGCRFMVSNDRRLPVAPGVQVVQLGPHSLDVIRSADS